MHGSSRDMAKKLAETGGPQPSDGMWHETTTTTPIVPGVYACIVNVSAEIAKEGISKTRMNQQQGYPFRGIDDVLNALAPMLAKHGLVILPRCLSRNVVERQTQKGGTLFYVTIEAEFDFVCAADGSTHTVRMFGEAMDSADKATNKAMSAAYKYAAFQTFCIPTEGEDADETTHEILPAPAAAPSAPLATRGGIQAAATGENRGTTAASPAVHSAAVVSNTAEPPVVDRGSRPDPPYGYVYVDDYKHSDNGFHDVRVGRTKYSTKDAVGRIAGEAWGTGRPVKIASSPKRDKPGEHWLNGVTVWTEPVDDDGFPL